MTQPNETQATPPETPVTNPAPVAQPPAQTTPPPVSVPAPQTPQFFQTLGQSLEALPERVANAVREAAISLPQPPATQQPNTPQQPSTSPATTPATSQTPVQPPKRKSVADWWFGA